MPLAVVEPALAAWLAVARETAAAWRAESLNMLKLPRSDRASAAVRSWPSALERSLWSTPPAGFVDSFKQRRRCRQCQQNLARGRSRSRRRLTNERRCAARGACRQLTWDPRHAVFVLQDPRRCTVECGIDTGAALYSWAQTPPDTGKAGRDRAMCMYGQLPSKHITLHNTAVHCCQQQGFAKVAFLTAILRDAQHRGQRTRSSIRTV